MSELLDTIKNEEYGKYEPITKKDYDDAKEKLSEKEFAKLYYFGGDVYYKKTYDDMTENEMGLHLLYQSLRMQRKNSKKIIALIVLMVFPAIFSLAVLILFVTEFFYW